MVLPFLVKENGIWYLYKYIDDFAIVGMALNAAFFLFEGKNANFP